MRVKSNLLRKSKTNITKQHFDYYEGIEELPLFNWIKCTSNDLTFVRKDKKGIEQEDIEAWERIYDSYALSGSYHRMEAVMDELPGIKIVPSVT